LVGSHKGAGFKHTVCFGDGHIRRGFVDDDGTRRYAVVTFSDGTSRQ